MKPILTLLISFFFVLKLNAQNKDLTASPSSHSKTLQASIDQFYSEIEQYYILSSKLKLNNKQSLENELLSLTKKKTEKTTKLKELSKKIITVLSNSESLSDSSKSIDVIAGLKKQKKEFDSCYNEWVSTILLINRKEQTIKDFIKLDKLKEKANTSRKNMTTIVKSLPEGEYSFIFKKETYYAFITNPAKQEIKITNGNDNPIQNKARGVSIDKFIQSQNNSNNDILMITNGGMFDRNLAPVGLLVTNDSIIKDVNKGKSANNNFFMLPNGIFFTKNDSVFVSETNTFINKKIKPNFATQSGPLLLNNGKRHDKFNYGSPNVYNRSGVGIMPNNRAVFIISKNQNTNFFDFSSIFKDVFSCNDALYLDGAISQMYLKNKKSLKTRGRNFGSLIYVKAKND